MSWQIIDLNLCFNLRFKMGQNGVKLSEGKLRAAYNGPGHLSDAGLILYHLLNEAGDDPFSDEAEERTLQRIGEFVEVGGNGNGRGYSNGASNGIINSDKEARDHRLSVHQRLEDVRELYGTIKAQFGGNGKSMRETLEEMFRSELKDAIAWSGKGRSWGNA